MQCARIIFSHVACLALQYFSTYLIKGTFGGGDDDLLKIKCAHWLTLQLLPETLFTLVRIKQDMMKNVFQSSSKVPVI